MDVDDEGAVGPEVYVGDEVAVGQKLVGDEVVVGQKSMWVTRSRSGQKSMSATVWATSSFELRGREGC